jgi:hypothetical protein
MRKVIKVKLDPQSISNAIKELERYKKDLERRVRFLLEELTYRGVEIAKAKVVEHGIIHDMNLTNSINGFIMGNQGFIRVDDEHAVFFEFGTGPVGKLKPHPSKEGKYVGGGWYTQADGKPMDDLYGWTPHTAKDGNTIYWTMGQPSKPFMYDTAQQLREDFSEIVKRVFG